MLHRRMNLDRVTLYRFNVHKPVFFCFITACYDSMISNHCYGKSKGYQLTLLKQIQVSRLLQ